MRRRLLLALGFATATLAPLACDSHDIVASLGGGGEQPTRVLILSPNSLQLEIGFSARLATNAGSFANQIEWRTSNANIATVSGTGIVTGYSAGTVAISARYVTDPDNVATAVVTVVP